MTKVLTLMAALLAALGVAALAGAASHPKTVTQACFGVQLKPPAGSGISHGDVNIFAKQGRVCIVGRRGPRGLAGKAGAAGATGAQGPAGKDAVPAPRFSISNGCLVITPFSGIINGIGILGHAPQTLCPAAGATGPAGPAGPQGSAGPAGTSGLGNGIGYICVANGNNVKWGGTDGSLCDPGHDTLVKVVTVTP